MTIPTTMRQTDAVWPHACPRCVLVGQVALGTTQGVCLWDVYQCGVHSWVIRTGEEPDALYLPQPDWKETHWSAQLMRALVAAKHTIEGV